MSTNTKKRLLALTAALFLSVSGAGVASATTIEYTNYSSVGDVISITAPRTVTGIAGQITLTGVTATPPGGFASTIVAWCLDIAHDLINSGKYTTGTSASVPGDPGHIIGGLMVEGNNFIAQGSGQANNTVNVYGSSYKVKDISAATQIAIWTAEYGAAFTYIPINADVTALVGILTSHAVSGVTYGTLNPYPDGTHNQMLGYLPVPGPVVGAGVPGLTLGLSGIFAWWRRKRLKGQLSTANA